MGDMGDPIAEFSDHIVDHFTNEKFVLNDENARRVLRLVGHQTPNEPSAIACSGLAHGDECTLWWMPPKAGGVSWLNTHSWT
jgi:hypothetical protein